MFFPNHMERWYLPDVIIGRYVDIIGPANATEIALHVPALMPNIPFGLRNITTSSLSNSCFCNDSSCKPSLSGSIQTQNYLMLPVQANRAFRKTHFKRGMELELDSLNGNPDIITISNRRDPSIIPP